MTNAVAPEIVLAARHDDLVKVGTLYMATEHKRRETGAKLPEDINLVAKCWRSLETKLASKVPR
jgi:hypothetical protein